MSWDPFETEGNLESRSANSAPARSAYESQVQSSSSKYDFVKIGLRLVCLAWVGGFLGYMSYLIYLFSFVGVGNFFNASPLVMSCFLIFSGLVGVLLFVGYCFCCAAPKEKEREKIHVAVALQILCVLVAVVGVPAAPYLLGTINEAERAGIMFSVTVLAQIVGALSTFFFISFCVQLGIGSQQVTDAADKSKIWLMVLVCSLVATSLTLISTLIWPFTNESLIRKLFLILMTLILVGSSLAYCIMSVSLVQKAIDFLKEKADRKKFKKLPRRHKKQASQAKKTSET